MPISAQEWRARTGVNNAGRVCRPVSSSPSSGKWEGVTVGRSVCVPGPLLYKACTLVLLMLLLLAGISDHEPGGQKIVEPSSVPGLESEVCVSVLCVVPVLCMAYSLVVRMLLLLSGDVERNPGPLTMSDHPKLVELTVPMISEWKRLGVQLNVSIDKLNTIQASHHGHPHWLTLCMVDMLDLWVKLGEATYEKLVEALCGIDRADVASDVSRKCGCEFSAKLAAVSKLPGCLAKYSQTLKEQYRRFSVLPDSEWPPSVGDQFINLALINEDIQCATGESVEEMQRDYVHGKLDKIVSYKTKITKENILKPVYDKRTKEQIPLRALLDGAPGAGKTTLCRELCQEWADGKLLQNYELVVLVHLRDRNNKQAQSIEDFFFHDPSILRSEIAKHINRENVLFIFDGFDELSYEDRTQHSVFLDIIAGRVLHKCSIVVTSRPHASETLQRSKSINRHVQVLGFTEKQIGECIKRTVKDQSKAEELCTRLKERLDITSLCSIPLNCAIMLYVYQQENFRLPNTLTELYDIFILNALKRHTKRIGIKNRLRNLDKLPPLLDSHFKALCKMAYEGLIADKLVFTEEDLDGAFGSDSDTDVLGLDLLTATRSYNSRGDELTYHFLHLTIQEFLAAKWVAAMALDSPDEAVIFFRDNLENDRLRLTLLFAAGLTKLKFSNPSSLFQHQFGVFSIWHHKFILLCHMMYESRNYEFTRSVAQDHSEKLEVDLYDTSIFDLIVLANFMKSIGTWKLLAIRNGPQSMFSSSISPHQLRNFCQVFSECKDVVIEKLEFNCSNMAYVQGLLDLEQTPCIRSVYVVADVAQIRIGDANVLRMEKLDHIDFCILPDIGTRFYTIFESSAHYTKLVFEALQSNDNLKILSCPIGSGAGPALEAMLSQNKSLDSLTLEMDSTKLYDKLYQHIAQGLAHNAKLRELTIVMKTFHFVDMCPIESEKLCTAICKQMAKVTSLLHIEKLTIELADSMVIDQRKKLGAAEGLVQLLANNTSLTHVRLSHILFTQSELKVVQRGLLKNNTLVNLSLRKGIHGIITYAQLLRKTESGKIDLFYDETYSIFENHSQVAETSLHLPRTTLHRPNNLVAQYVMYPTYPYSPDSAVHRSTTLTEMRKCGGCEKLFQERKLKRCSRCMKVAYCSKECQRNDWPRHKSHCKRH